MFTVYETRKARLPNLLKKQYWKLSPHMAFARRVIILRPIILIWFFGKTINSLLKSIALPRKAHLPGWWMAVLYAVDIMYDVPVWLITEYNLITSHTLDAYVLVCTPRALCVQIWMQMKLLGPKNLTSIQNWPGIMPQTISYYARPIWYVFPPKYVVCKEAELKEYT